MRGRYGGLVLFGLVCICLIFSVGSVSATGINARAAGIVCNGGGGSGVTYVPQQFAAPVYGPSYVTGSCGQAALFGQQFYPPSFAIQPRVFSAPVYAPQVFAVPVYGVNRGFNVNVNRGFSRGFAAPTFVQPAFIGGRGINVNVNRGFLGRTRVNVNAGF